MTRRVAMVGVAVLALLGSSRSWGYEVEIEPGLTPRMSPSVVAGMAQSARVRGAIGSGTTSPTVTTVRCIDGSVIRDAFSHSSMKSDSPLWIVHISGRFVEHRAPGPTRVNDRGYFIVDDADGRIIAFGSSSTKGAGSGSPEPSPFQPPYAEPRDP